MLKLLKESEIKIGMEVITAQLDNIVNKFIYISDPKIVPDEHGFPVYTQGRIEFIGNEQEKDEYLRTHKDAFGNQLLIINTPME